MVMTSTDTVGDTDIEILNELFNMDREPCSLGDCDHPAAWFLLCPYDRSAETVCSMHRQELLGWPKDHNITFDNTCGHNPDIGSCIWEPYTE